MPFAPGQGAPGVPPPPSAAHDADWDEDGDASGPHEHGMGCGHPPVRHGDHTDFLVDGVLHHCADGAPCVVHGTLSEIDQETLHLLTGLDNLKGAASAFEDTAARSTNDTAPEAPHPVA